MTTELEIGLYIFMLAAFLGYHLISRVPPLLHTPLMSATNAMSGISLIGSMVIAGAGYSPGSTMFGFIAVACSSTNVVGGFLITDRMLRMFRSEHDVAQRSGVATMLRKRWHIVVLGAGCWIASLAGGKAIVRLPTRFHRLAQALLHHFRRAVYSWTEGAQLTQACPAWHVLC